MKLSVLIVTLKSRKNLLDKIYSVLIKQATDDVEILINTDSGEKSTGKKRNELLEKAVGDYVCFVDDDDIVSDDYIELILKAIEKKPDCVGIEVLKTTNGKNPTRNIHSLKTLKGGYYWGYKGNSIYFIPDHLTPIRRELALKTKFKDISKGEDTYYSMNVLQYLKTEEYIDKPIYFYLYETKKKEYHNKSLKVSAMMLTYKRKEMFRRSFDCFKKQTYSDKELVIISNGTKEYNDYVENIVNGDSSVILVRVDEKPKDMTIGDLRNLAIEKSTGDYIINWDDDDISHKNRIQYQMNPIKLNLSNGSLLRSFQVKCDDKEYAISWTHGLETTLLFKKNELRYKSLNKGEDTDFLLRFAEQNAVNHLNLDAKLFTYCYHSENLCDRDFFESLIKNRISRN